MTIASDRNTEEQILISLDVLKEDLSNVRSDVKEALRRLDVKETDVEGIKEKLDLVSEIASANTESLVLVGKTLDRILKILKK